MHQSSAGVYYDRSWDYRYVIFARCCSTCHGGINPMTFCSNNLQSRTIVYQQSYKGRSINVCAYSITIKFFVFLFYFIPIFFRICFKAVIMIKTSCEIRIFKVKIFIKCRNILAKRLNDSLTKKMGQTMIASI